MGKELFAKRAVEKDTRIMSTEFVHKEGYDLLIEEWAWEGIKAKSLIFISDQVSHLADAQVEELARRLLCLSVKKSTTLKRKDDFTFFNFDFRS